MRVLITRAEPQASATAHLLEQMGHQAIKLPLSEIVDTLAPVSTQTFDGYIFTSSNAISVLEKRDWKPQNTNAPAFCVGQRTSERAREIGFSQIFTQEGGGKNLVYEIANYGLSPKSNLLYFTTPDRSFDMKSTLAAENIHVTNLEIYQAIEAEIAPIELENAFNPAPPHAVLSYSARSSDMLSKNLIRAGLADRLKGSILIAISTQAIGSLGAFDWQETRVPNVANEPAMLHILNKK